ncbi:MAG: hypothetical protein CM15mP59_0060 [Flavobacteriaceae bacterium]|nr:MAG: hypothetical protein CM15mP59_0060 [Flavobacteriaceae bacterium]
MNLLDQKNNMPFPIYSNLGYQQLNCVSNYYHLDYCLMSQLELLNLHQKYF